MIQHSKLAPSSAARRVACPGSRALEANYPEDKESPYAREGEAAHWVASEVLKRRGSISQLHNVAPNGEYITHEMVEGANLYCETIMNSLKKNEKELVSGSKLEIERAIDISTIHPECWGTPDCWFTTNKDLYIYDYKFGHGFVDVFENWQLIEYAAGIFEELKINGIRDNTFRVHFCIVQPRSYSRYGTVRWWDVVASDLRAYFNILRHAEEESFKNAAQCKPSPECTYCRGRHACEALQRSTLRTVDVTASNMPMELNSHELGRELLYLRHAAELLDARITGLSEQAIAMIRRGERVLNFNLEQSPGREVWNVPATDIITMGNLMGIDLAKKIEAITPKQAIKAGLPEQLIKDKTMQTKGSFKLVEHDTRKAFGGMNENN
jgi:hypothetical protein